jgi:hypothetical protein
MQEQYDTDSLRAASAVLWSHSEDLTKVLQRLQGSLPNVNSMSGSDDPGLEFAAAVRPAAGKLNQLLVEMAAGLDTGGRGLRTMATNLDEADDHSTVRGR